MSPIYWTSDARRAPMPWRERIAWGVVWLVWLGVGVVCTWGSR